MRNKKQRDYGFLIFMIALFGLALISSALKAAEFIPANAISYKRELVRASQTHWGLNGPVARFAAQVHQESSWRADAQSIYANGLAQFTPATAEWISGAYTITEAPYSPRWSLHALVRYDRHIYDRITGSATDCDRWAFTLSGYNGGPGWVSRDRSLTTAQSGDANRWFCSVERHSKRSDWAIKENRHYVRRILLELEPIYVRNSWSGESVCGAE